jgi:DNA-binding transcriptional regulator YhcF (GntR family)
MKPKKLPAFPPSSPAIQKAVTFIIDGLDKGLWKNGEQLPSIKQLSKQASVSRGTMVRALHALRDNGRLMIKPQGRIVAGNQSLHQSHNTATNGPWQQQRKRFEQDILQGVFSRHEQLPSFKELQARYGVCFRSMRKIINACVADRILLPHMRGYILPGFPKSRSNSTIVFVTQSNLVVSGQPVDDRSYKLFDLLESECARLDINLRRVDIDFYSPDYLSNGRLPTGKNEVVLGYIVDLWWFEIPEYQEHVTGYFEHLVIAQKPVAIMDQNGNFILPESLARNRLFQVFKIAGISAGQAVGRLLLNLGHRRVAFISLDHNYPFSIRRLEGLQACYEKAGMSESVQPFVSTMKHFLYAHVLALSDIPKSRMAKIIAMGRTDAQARLLFEAYKELKKEYSRKNMIDEKMQNIRKNLRFLEPLTRGLLDSEYQEDLTTLLLAIAESQLFPRLLETFFDSVVKDKNITAWVCVNDAIAEAALKYLEEHHIDVPGKISIVGFDNSHSAKMNKITSFDFNVHSFIHRMLGFISAPARRSARFMHSPIEIEGVIIRRATTGQGPGQQY